ncbi:MAG: hypothetical protein IT245_02705, partial [Bacteroidia bacterium]|nr:hypothetical protein [Bacteroidia bacterium]
MKKSLLIVLAIVLTLNTLVGQKVTKVVNINFVSNLGARPSWLLVFGNFLYMNANDGDIGSELWRTNGNLNNSLLIKDINPGINSSGPGRPYVHNGKMYFSAYDGGTTGVELWVSDG